MITYMRLHAVYFKKTQLLDFRTPKFETRLAYLQTLCMIFSGTLVSDHLKYPVIQEKQAMAKIGQAQGSTLSTLSLPFERGGWRPFSEEKNELITLITWKKVKTRVGKS